MRLLLTILFSFLLISTTGCSTNPKENTSENKLNKHTITDFSDRDVYFEKIPTQIVSVGNGELDILYALGEKVIGRPTGNVLVEESADALEIGSSHSIDLEKITSLNPDLVLGNEPMNANDVQAIENLGSQMVLTSANSVNDIKDQINLLGDIFEKSEKAEELVNIINSKIEEIQSEQTNEPPRVLLVYGAPGTNMAALPNSLSGNILELAGGENIASDYPSLEVYPQYAQINTERIIEANPQIILLMAHGNPEEVKDSFTKEMLKTAGWSELDAVKNEHFYILPANLFGTNPGTKVTDALEYLQDLLKVVKK